MVLTKKSPFSIWQFPSKQSVKLSLKVFYYKKYRYNPQFRPRNAYSIFCTFFKLPNYDLKSILFYFEYQKTILCGQISQKTQTRKTSIFDKNHGLTPLQIFDFLHFFQTLIFWSKQHSFLSRISKNDLLWLDFPKKRI